MKRNFVIVCKVKDLKEEIAKAWNKINKEEK